MRSALRSILAKPVIWVANRYTSAPHRQEIFDALNGLRSHLEEEGSKGFVLPFSQHGNRFIILSDQHKGRKNGADDFRGSEHNYLEALAWYDRHRYHLVSLGDAEELWENTLLQVIRHNQASYALEKKFVKRNAFTKVVGNHDLDWDIDPLGPTYIKKLYGVELPVLHGLILETRVDGSPFRILCTHGHQGDRQSDGNWFSKFFITKIWAPLQSFLEINPNTPAFDRELKTEHNRIMHDWAMLQQNMILITGHTHQAVFESLTRYERLQWLKRQALYNENREWAEAIENEMQWRKSEDTHIADEASPFRPVYFNTGCCCYADGDITGIEIADGWIRLIKWKQDRNAATRIVLQERVFDDLVRDVRVPSLKASPAWLH